MKESGKQYRYEIVWDSRDEMEIMVITICKNVWQTTIPTERYN